MHALSICAKNMLVTWLLKKLLLRIASFIFVSSNTLNSLKIRLLMVSFMSFLSQTLLTVDPQTVSSYFPLMLQFALAGIVVIALMLLTHTLGPKRHTEDKLINFESGVEQIGNARKPMGVKYFVVAILF